VRHIGIDEISLHKGHRDFCCVLVDLETNQVIEVLPERTKDYLIKYFNGLGKEFCNQIKVVSSDMWDGFTTLKDSVFPNAMVVIDRFHFASTLNKQLDDFRKSLKKDVFVDKVADLRKLRFGLLKSQENVTQDEYCTLIQAFALSSDLEIFYNLKQELKLIFDSKITRKEAEKKINNWIESAKNLSNKYLDKFIKTFQNWKDKVLNFFHLRLSNGVVEGKNNKIKLIKRRGYGYLNFENFRLRVLSEC